MIALNTGNVAPLTGSKIEQRPFLILKMGSTFAEISALRGDFENWIAAACEKTSTFSYEVLHVPSGLLPARLDWAGILITGSHAMVSDNPSWQRPIMAWLERAISKGIPVLGICFGHQLLAEMAGGRVGNHPCGLEIGTCTIETTGSAVTDPLFEGLPNRFSANTVHYQSVLQLPATATVLACNNHDQHHAYRIDDSVWGVQFHPEFDRLVMRGYIDAVAARGESVGSADTGNTPHAESLLRHFTSFCLSG